MILDDTIAAIASPPGSALRGIVRISGLGSIACVQKCFNVDPAPDWQGLRRNSTFEGRLELLGFSSMVPCRALVWPTQRSYTRQPTIELHMIGSPPILDAALETICQSGARLANPGEFTLRAFLAGRIDLPQAEAVLGVIDAQSHTELCAALDQLAGGLSGLLGKLRGELLDLCADLEAGLDFVEEDIEFVTASELRSRLAAAATSLTALLDEMGSRTRDTRTHRIALVGHPNVGKSSLLNAMVGQDAAIVSSTPGTTRDYVHQNMTIAGFDCELVDTAGVDETTKDIETAAQRKTLEQIQSSDLVLACLDWSERLVEFPRPIREALVEKTVVKVLTKCDLERRIPLDQEGIRTSSHHGQGFADLKRGIAGQLGIGLGESHRVVDFTAVRSRESLRSAIDAVRESLRLCESQQGEELIAAELRSALDHLGVIVGAVYTDDVLDRIFSRFCIGK